MCPFLWRNSSTVHPASWKHFRCSRAASIGIMWSLSPCIQTTDRGGKLVNFPFSSLFLTVFVAINTSPTTLPKISLSHMAEAMAPPWEKPPSISFPGGRRPSNRSIEVEISDSISESEALGPCSFSHQALPPLGWINGPSGHRQPHPLGVISSARGNILSEVPVMP